MNHTELADALQDFAGLGWIPGITQILDGLTTIDHAARTGRLSADATQTLLTTIANPNGPDLTHLLALTIKTLTGPDNQALHGLDDDTRKQIQHLGEQHAWETAEYAPRDQPNEAAGLIYQHSPHGGATPANDGQCSQCGGRFPGWPGGICDACKNRA